MLLIYSHTVSNRWQYICSFIFKEQLGIDFKITIDSQKFKEQEVPKINYSDSKITATEFYIKNHALLFEQQIKEQVIECFTENEHKAFFKTENSDFPFDLFAAAFYLLSRYEEYLPHEKDMYGRYGHQNALAFKQEFLRLPLVNIWINEFAKALSQKFSSLAVQLPGFKFVPTYDIDIAYSYKHKGVLRNIGGFLKSPSLARINVLTGFQKDPFDCYGWLNDLHQQHNLNPIFFFLVAEKNGSYDKNILPHKDTMWKLVKQHAKKYQVGLHPSWQSGDEISLLKKEKEQLEAMCSPGLTAGSDVTRSRQHYIRFHLPQGYQRLIDAGITDDYSMGYGSINGFRASVASSFYWYDLENDQQTSLRIHPFCFMEANSYYEQKQDPAQSFEEMMHYLQVCKKVNGTLISIWHNNFLGTATEFKDWKNVYEKFIFQAQQ
ncbi:MAG: polysaccharide deacetylase family protein [Ferruginibacter sp.]